LGHLVLKDFSEDILMEFSETDFGRHMAFLKMHPGQSLSAVLCFSWETTLKQPEAK
jgi:hypothetical protein